MPLAVGSIIGGGSETQTATLRAFGMASGLAFQIQDDVLNLVGTREATKKDFRSDITEGKRTLVAVHALEHSAARERLLTILSAHETDPKVLAEAVDIMREAGSVDFANTYAERLVVDAKTALEAELLRTKARDLLASMADFFIKRNS